jgi:hypothetical protein
MAAGCTAFFTKPVSFAVLETTLNTLLEERREQWISEWCRSLASDLCQMLQTFTYAAGGPGNLKLKVEPVPI